MPTPEALRPTSTRNGHFRLSSYFYNGLEMSPGHLRLVPRNISAEDEVDIARYDAVRSARHMLRSNPQIAAAITRNSDMTIGGFLQVLPSPDFDMLGITNKEEIKKFKDQAKRACPKFGQFAAKNRQLRSEIEQGGAFLRSSSRRRRRAKCMDLALSR